MASKRQDTLLRLNGFCVTLTNRFFLSAVFLAMLVLVSLIYALGGEPLLRSFLGTYLIHYDLPPFGDAHGITSAMACERQGIETYLGNPCHYKPVGFVYPPIWKLLRYLPVDGSWEVPLALGFIAVFALALCFIPPGESRRGRVLMALAVVSPATLMAVNYGNNDLVVFALLVAAIAALGLSGKGRALGYGLLVFTGLLKFFPFAAMGWAATERPRIAAAVVAALALVLFAFVLLAGEQLPLSLASMVTMSAGSYVFGLKDLAVMATEMGLAGPGSAWALRIGLTTVLLVAGWQTSKRYAALNLPEFMTEVQWRFLVIGALVLLGAYLGNQNLAYRMIFVLLLLPGLDALRRVPGERFGQMAIIAVALMYFFPLRIHLEDLFAQGSQGRFLVSVAGILLREALWIGLATTLLGLVFAYLRSGPIWQRIAAARRA